MAFDIRQAIIETANALGMPPEDLATIISYESGFNPNIWGGKGGQHYGSIQFGPSERQQYGVEVGNPASQFGENGAIARYFRDRGWKPGMSFMDAYSTVNAGRPGLYNASDTAAGGQPGNVRQKVEGQMDDDRRAAQKLLGGIAPTSDTSRAGVQGDYDPRLDTPSSGRPGGSELPGPPSQYDLVARHPPNPQVGTGGYVKPGAPTTGVGDVDSDDVIADLKSKPDKLAELGKGIMGGSLGTGGFNYQVPPVSQPGLAQAQPASMIDPQQASNKRQMLAYLMQRLNQGVLA